MFVISNLVNKISICCRNCSHCVMVLCSLDIFLFKSSRRKVICISSSANQSIWPIVPCISYYVLMHSDISRFFAKNLSYISARALYFSIEVVGCARLAHDHLQCFVVRARARLVLSTLAVGLRHFAGGLLRLQRAARLSAQKQQQAGLVLKIASQQLAANCSLPKKSYCRTQQIPGDLNFAKESFVVIDRVEKV